jgi:hypothetical protein
MEPSKHTKTSMFTHDGGVSHYYRAKAKLAVNDEYHERIEEKDIRLLQKAIALVVVAPFVGVVVMHLLKSLKKDLSFSERFMYRIRSAQDTLFASTATYHRSADLATAPEPQIKGKESREEAEKLRDLYSEIKQDSAAQKSEADSRLRQMTEQIRQQGQQGRVRNASPFFKNQQAKRFGIDGSRRVTSQKERN